MRKITVAYSGGQSRYGENHVDYMLAVVDNRTELYAEIDPVRFLSDEQKAVWELVLAARKWDGDPEAFEDLYDVEYDEYRDMEFYYEVADGEVDHQSYEYLKAEIVKQAERCGIPVSELDFA